MGPTPALSTPKPCPEPTEIYFRLKNPPGHLPFTGCCPPELMLDGGPIRRANLNRGAPDVLLRTLSVRAFKAPEMVEGFPTCQRPAPAFRETRLQGRPEHSRQLALSRPLTNGHGLIVPGGPHGAPDAD